MHIDGRRWEPISTAAELVNRHRSTVRHWVRQGKIRHTAPAGVTLVCMNDLRAYAKRRAEPRWKGLARWLRADPRRARLTTRQISQQYRDVDGNLSMQTVAWVRRHIGLNAKTKTQIIWDLYQQQPALTQVPGRKVRYLLSSRQVHVSMALVLRTRRRLQAEALKKSELQQ